MVIFYQIIAKGARADKRRPIVCFGSFQDFLGYNRETGGIKPTNEWGGEAGEYILIQEDKVSILSHLDATP